MEYSDIKKLIPFYIAGTLKPDEKKLVENALRDSGELKKEFEFWLKAKEVVAQHAPRLKEHHLTPEQIVGYIENNYRGNKPELEIIESHIQTCDNCRSDIEIIRSTYTASDGKHEIFAENISEQTGIVGKIDLILNKRFIDLFATAAVIFIVVVTILTNLNIDSKIVIHEKHYANLVLTYQNDTRGENANELPVLVDDSLTDGAKVLLYIPHSEIDSLRYDISLKTPLGMVIPIAFRLESARSNTTSDTLRFFIERNKYSESVGEYAITIKEILPTSLSHITSEFYTYNFNIRKSHTE